MARKVLCLLCPLLLVVLAFGAWAQDTEFLKLEEGETLLVSCEYGTYGRTLVKSWCRQTSAKECAPLVTSVRTLDSRCSIKDSKYGFEVTMTGLRVQDSGVYWCGFLRGLSYNFKSVHLEVSKAPTPRPTSSTQRTMTAPAPASDTSPATDSPSGGWKWKGVVVGMAVAVLLLLLGLSVLMALYLQRARGGAQNGGGAGGGERDGYHVYEDCAALKESSDFEQPVPSDQDTRTVHYASLTHLSHSGTEDPTDSDSCFLSVEYASIAGHSPQPSAPAGLEGEPRS